MELKEEALQRDPDYKVPSKLRALVEFMLEKNLASLDYADSQYTFKITRIPE